MSLFARRTQRDKKFLASLQSEIGAGPRSASVERVAQLCFQPNKFRRAEIFSSGDCGVLPLASCVAEPMDPYRCMYGCIHAVFPCSCSVAVVTAVVKQRCVNRASRGIVSCRSSAFLLPNWASEKMKIWGDIRIRIRCIAVYCITSPSTPPDRSRPAGP